MGEAVTDPTVPAAMPAAGMMPEAKAVPRPRPALLAGTPSAPGPAELAAMRRNLGRCRNIYIADVRGCGLGIFSAVPVRAGRAIVVEEDAGYFDGMIDEAQVRRLGLDLSIHCFQVGHDRYLLPRGSIDDLINHSCEPNCGIRLSPLGYRLIALRDIATGDQLTYDYSTYIGNPRERMACACASPCCRREVGPFRELPPERRAFYLAHDVVGPFLLDKARPAARLAG